MKTVELRRIITTALLQVHPRVYFQVADEKADYPYLVFDLPNSMDDLSMEQFVLDVDGWDAPVGGDTMALETLMASVDTVLHRKTVLVNGLSATFYRENRLPLLDDNKQIRRRKYVYQIRTHGG